MAPMADQVCQSLIERLPNSLQANLIMGQIRHDAGLEQEAAPYLKVAGALDPEGRIAHKVFGEQAPIPLADVQIPYLEYKGKALPIELAQPAPAAAEDMTIPLLTNPLNPGAPDMDSEAIMHVIAVTGIFLAKPPNSVRLFLPVR